MSLKTEQNTRSMERRILRAYREWVRQRMQSRTRVRPSINAHFEHGQWWITNRVTGAAWSVVDAEGGRSVDGFDFESINNGDDE